MISQKKRFFRENIERDTIKGKNTVKIPKKAQNSEQSSKKKSEEVEATGDRA